MNLGIFLELQNKENAGFFCRYIQLQDEGKATAYYSHNSTYYYKCQVWEVIRSQCIADRPALHLNIHTIPFKLSYARHCDCIEVDAFLQVLKNGVKMQQHPLMQTAHNLTNSQQKAIRRYCTTTHYMLLAEPDLLPAEIQTFIVPNPTKKNKYMRRRTARNESIACIFPKKIPLQKNGLSLLK